MKKAWLVLSLVLLAGMGFNVWGNFVLNNDWLTFLVLWAIFLNAVDNLQ